MTSISKDPVVIAAANTIYSKLKELSPDNIQNSIHNFEQISNKEHEIKLYNEVKNNVNK